eukprot:Pgem_evm2s4590
MLRIMKEDINNYTLYVAEDDGAADLGIPLNNDQKLTEISFDALTIVLTKPSYDNTILVTVRSKFGDTLLHCKPNLTYEDILEEVCDERGIHINDYVLEYVRDNSYTSIANYNNNNNSMLSVNSGQDSRTSSTSKRNSTKIDSVENQYSLNRSTSANSQDNNNNL